MAACCGATLRFNVKFKLEMLEDDQESRRLLVLCSGSVGNSEVKDFLNLMALCSYFQRKPWWDRWSDITRGPWKRLLNVGDF